jgi:hypothetical protein
MKKHANRLITSFTAALQDASPAIRRAYASAIANLAKVSPPNALKNVIAKVNEFYLMTEVSFSNFFVVVIVADLEKNYLHRMRACMQRVD